MNQKTNSVAVHKETSTGKILAGGAIIGLLMLNPITWVLAYILLILAFYVVYLVFAGGVLGTVGILGLIHDHPFLFAGALTLLLGLPVLKEVVLNRQKISALEERLKMLENK